MTRQPLEVADIFRSSGPAWRQQRKGHVYLDQLKVMSAIERCRTAELGGHVLCCTACEHVQIAYNSCRNRHCPKCQAIKAKHWLDARQAELLPVEYYHVVFTMPAILADLTYQNKDVIYPILFKAAAETLMTIARDPKHLGARIGVTQVLHTWGSALTHHPHVHCIVPGGGFSEDGKQWIACKPGFFLPVRVLSRLFRRLFLDKLHEAYQADKLKFFGQFDTLTQRKAFDDWCKPLKEQDWVVYAKRPFAGPEAVLAYLSRSTHRVAIANSRLISHDEQGVTFKWKDYRVKGRKQQKIMTLKTDDFIQRFLLHVLPSGFHRIRYYGFFSNTVRANNLSHARELLDCVTEDNEDDLTNGDELAQQSPFVCPSCSAPMNVIESFLRNHVPRAPPTCIGLQK